MSQSVGSSFSPVVFLSITASPRSSKYLPSTAFGRIHTYYCRSPDWLLLHATVSPPRICIGNLSMQTCKGMGGDRRPRRSCGTMNSLRPAALRNALGTWTLRHCLIDKYKSCAGSRSAVLHDVLMRRRNMHYIGG